MTSLEKEIEAYLSGEMTQDQVLTFEKKLQTDPDLKKDITTYKEMETILNEEDWEVTNQATKNKKVLQYEAFLKSEEGQHIIANIKETEQRFFEKKTTPRLKRTILYVASIAAAFCILFFSIYKPNGNPDSMALFEEYKSWDDLPTYTTKGIESQDIVQAEKLFNNQNYKEALPIFEALQNTSNEDLTSLYIGISQLEIDQNEHAAGTFKKLVNHWKYSARARWYLSLAYLKTSDVKSAKEQLELIISDQSNYNYEKAKKLLEEIK